MHYRNAFSTAKRGVCRVGEPQQRGNWYTPSRQHQRLFCRRMSQGHNTSQKMEKDIWHLVKEQHCVKLTLAGPWDPSSFLLLLSHARQVCLIFPSESCSSVRFTRGGSCWERDWETRICQRVVLFPTALADWPKSYKKKNQIQEKALNVSRLLEQMAQEVFPVAIGVYFFLFFIYLFKPL